MTGGQGTNNKGILIPPLVPQNLSNKSVIGDGFADMQMLAYMIHLNIFPYYFSGRFVTVVRALPMDAWIGLINGRRLA